MSNAANLLTRPLVCHFLNFLARCRPCARPKSAPSQISNRASKLSAHHNQQPTGSRLSNRPNLYSVEPKQRIYATDQRGYHGRNLGLVVLGSCICHSSQASRIQRQHFQHIGHSLLFCCCCRRHCHPHADSLSPPPPGNSGHAGHECQESRHVNTRLGYLHCRFQQKRRSRYCRRKSHHEFYLLHWQFLRCVLSCIFCSHRR